MYHTLAHLYDWAGTEDFAERIFRKDLAAFKTHGLPAGARILDLACGTGNLSYRLANAGYRVIGIDQSSTMLEQAGSKQAELAPQTIAPLWITADMREFDLSPHPPVDAVVCHYDSLNHLPTRDDFQKTLSRVDATLKPGGLFLFDLNTLENYQTFWNGEDTDEGRSNRGSSYRLTTQTVFDSTSATGIATFIAQEYDDEGRLQTREESFSVNYFPDEWVEDVLRKAGFTDITHEPFNPTDDIPNDLTLKTFWTCSLQ